MDDSDVDEPMELDDLTAETLSEHLADMMAYLNDISNLLRERIPPKDVLDLWIEIAGGIVNEAQGDPQPEYVYMLDRSRLIARQLLIFAAGMRQGDASLCDKYGIEPGTVFVALRRQE